MPACQRGGSPDPCGQCSVGDDRNGHVVGLGFGRAVCIIGNATLAFGTYNPTAATAATATTTVTLSCSLGTPYNIGMSSGTGAGATTTLRVMTATSATLGYSLYQDSGYTMNWGNTVGQDTLYGTSSGSTLNNSINIYGRIPAGEAAANGSYTDSVTMTVTY